MAVEDVSLESKQPKKRKNVKQKGNRFELVATKFIVEKYNEHFPEDTIVYGEDIRRTPNSGGLKDTNDWKNDLIIMDKKGNTSKFPERFKFGVECKAGYDWDISDIPKKCKSSIIFQSTDQCEENITQNSEERPLVVLKRDRDIMYAIFRDLPIVDKFSFVIRFNYKEFVYYMVSFEEFLDVWFSKIKTE